VATVIEDGAAGRRPRLRVVQWATGSLGRHAVGAILDHPDLELVGARVYSEDKDGRDVGEICGLARAGVIATRDVEAILAIDADCVLYAAQGELNPPAAVDDICQLLASGKNVVSTAVTALIWPASMGGNVVDRLERACATGSASFHATGIQPGWASEVLPLTMSGLMRRIDHIKIQELMDYSNYSSTDIVIHMMGFGQPPDAEVPMGMPELIGGAFHAPIQLLAAGLGETVDEFTFYREVAVTDHTFTISAGEISAGTVAAQRFGFTGIVDGRPAITIEHITRVHPDQAPEWPRGRGWRVEMHGSPSMMVDATIAVHGEDEVEQGLIGAAMHAIHAIPLVCAAERGIRTFLDLPHVLGRGTLTSAKHIV
jgi:hypothetical protein